MKSCSPNQDKSVRQSWRLCLQWKTFGFVLIHAVVVRNALAHVETENAESDEDSVSSKAEYDHLSGHLKPLGSHRPPEGTIDVVDGFIQPHTFFENYVSQSKPVLFKGAASHIPAFSLWNDDYLLKNYGHLPVDVEEGKKEDRQHEMLRMPLGRFLDRYNSSDIYLVQDVLPEMMDELCVPMPLQCGGAQHRLELAIVWFSSGGTKSVLHLDTVENINCLLDGHKTLVLIDKFYEHLVEAEGFVAEGGYSQVDVERVDMNLFQYFQHIPWWSASMERGDCLYIPHRWYHTVWSGPGRNLAVNLWYIHQLWLNQTDCDTRGPSQPCDRLSLYTLWSHPGGEGSTERLRTDVFEVFEGEQHVSLERAVDTWGQVANKLEIQAVFEVVDQDKDLELSWQEMHSVDIMGLLSDFPFLHPAYLEHDAEELDDDWQQTHEEL